MLLLDIFVSSYFAMTVVFCYDGDVVIAHEFDFSVSNQLIYSRNGVNITSTPVSHYRTDGPIALRLDWNGLSITYSGR